MLLGCSRSVLTTEQGAALVAAEDRWKRSGVRDYSFEFRPFDGLAFDECAARIEVRGGVVEKVRELGSLRSDPTTIDALFQAIHRSETSGDYARIEAQYDPVLGYPTRIDFRAAKGIRDGNLIIEVRGFKDLSGR
jgi:hypothetical protein